MAVISRFLLGGFQNPALVNLLLGSSGVIELAAIAWYQEDEVKEADEADEVQDHFVRPLPIGTQALTTSLSFSAAEALDEFLEAMIGRADAIAAEAIDRLHTSTRRRREETDPRHLNIFLHLLYTIQMRSLEYEQSHNLSEPHPIHHALMTPLSISVVTKALGRLSSLTPQEGEEYQAALQWGFLYLVNALEDREGLSMVSVTLKFGLLKTFVRCAPIFSRFSFEALQAVLRIIDDILPRYLVHRLVIHIIRPYISKLKGARVEARIDGSVIEKSWYAFRHLALQRLYIRTADKWDRTRWCEMVRSIQSACSNQGF